MKPRHRQEREPARVISPRAIPVIMASLPDDLDFRARRAAARYLMLNEPSPRARLVVIVRELQDGELEIAP